MLIFDDDNSRAMTLSELNGLVKEVITLSLDGDFWVEAELASVHESRGHCYMELVEKQERNNTPVAQARACCWCNTWMRLEPKFIRTTGETLHAGMKVLLRVKANFHEAYGFSWIVNDIDPTYTLGDMARRRQEILQILKDEGVIDLNKSLSIPMFAKRIAVISSATAAGYGDFCNQLVDNDYGFAFTTRLFPAVMQGEGVEQSVINALDNINEEIDNFDVVVIIRGGGSTADLSGFDTLALAENVANFPLPIITGIGHDRDQSVLDVIACVSMKTPTAVAAFLIDNLANTLDTINDITQRISTAVRNKMERENMRIQRIEQYISTAFSIKKIKAESMLNDYASRIRNAISQRLLIEQNRITTIQQRLPLTLKGRIERENMRLQLLEQRTRAVDPINILRRGYSITLHNGISVKDPATLKQGDEITILVENGVINATTK
ncbi:MAG: exodeoxyribonuclease VII large subunit [Prevotella sp.]|nr:exodeoxyribonuclease VII large subunit [Candidatus Prevotella equi]